MKICVDGYIFFYLFLIYKLKLFKIWKVYSGNRIENSVEFLVKINNNIICIVWFKYERVGFDK